VSAVSSIDDKPLSPVSKARLAAEIVWAYLRVRRSLGRDSLPMVVTSLRGPGTTPAALTVLPDAERDGYRLSRAVVRTIGPLPAGTRCLTRSLVLLRVLARRGVTGELVIAVQPGIDVPLDAHAWIEVSGRPLLAPAPDFGRLLTL
jgi:hypothetical protein